MSKNGGEIAVKRVRVADLLLMDRYMHELHTPAVVYEVLVPYLTGDKTFLEAWAAGERDHPQLQGDFETLQSEPQPSCWHLGCILPRYV